MTTVGQILKNRRVEKRLSLNDAEKATKIRLKFLQALEEGHYDLLPPPTFVRGFIRNYASYLGLPVEEVLAFYRRESVTERAPLIPKKIEHSPRKFALTPGVFMIAGVTAMVLLFAAYLFGQYLSFTSAPILSVDQPKDYTVVTSSPISVSGHTDPSATISINNAPVTVDENGNFKIDVPLSSGLNTITVVSLNRFNKESRIVRQIRLETP